MANNPQPGATQFNAIEYAGAAVTIGGVAMSVYEYDASGNILMATSTGTPPASAAGFAKNATVINTSAATGVSGSYTNLGTTSSSTFSAPTANANLIRGFVQVALSSAQILALNSTPVELVPAQGAGMVISVNRITVKMITTATAYAAGGALEFRYTNASGTKVTADIAAAVVTAGAGTSYTAVAGVTTSLTELANANIVIDNATQAFTTGTGTAVVSIDYTVTNA